MEFCEDIVREEILIEFDDGTKPKKDSKEKSRKKDILKQKHFLESKKLKKLDTLLIQLK